MTRQTVAKLAAVACFLAAFGYIRCLVEAQPAASLPNVPTIPLREPFLTFAGAALQDFSGWAPRCELISEACSGRSKGLQGIMGLHAPAAAYVIVDHSVWFNFTAANYVSALKGAGGSRGHPIQFPKGSTIARPFWAIILSPGVSPPDSGAIASVRLYDPSGGPFSPDHPGTPQNLFPPKLIDLNNTSCNNRSPGELIPLGCFFYVRLNRSNFERYQTDKGNAAPGRIAVLLAFHVIAKQADGLGGWNWATFWWQARPGGPQGGPYGNPPCYPDQESCNLPSNWGHYFGNIQKPVMLGGGIPPFFNPYIEGPQHNNRNLNCAVCHGFAAIPEAADVQSSLSLGSQGPTTFTRWQRTAMSYLQGKAPTDSDWSIAEYLGGYRGVPEGQMFTDTDMFQLQTR